MQRSNTFSSTLTDMRNLYKAKYLNPTIDTNIQLHDYDDDDFSRNSPINKLKLKSSLPSITRVSKQVYSSPSNSNNMLSINKKIQSEIVLSIQNQMVDYYHKKIKKFKRIKFHTGKIRISPSKKGKRDIQRIGSEPLLEKHPRNQLF